MEKTICVWGDSIAWGAYDHEGGGWVERLKRHFLDDTRFGHVYNLGIGGDTSRRVLKRFNAEAEARKPTTIIFAIGTNDSASIGEAGDFWVPEKEFEKNVGDLIVKARAYTPRIIFVGLHEGDGTKTCPAPWSKKWLCYTNKNMRAYNEIIRSTCKRERVTLVDIVGEIKSSDLDTDGLHVNSHGHKKLFEAILHSL